MMRSGAGCLARSARELLTLPAPQRALGLVLATLALLLAFVDGGMTGAATVVIATAAVFVMASFVSERRDLRFVLFVTLTVLLAREACAAAFDMLTVARTGTHIFAPDESLYLRLADNIVANWRDPTVYINNDDGNVQSQYVRGIASIFFAFGTNPPVIKMLDTMLAVLMTLFVYRTMVNLMLPGRRWTLVLLLLFPSLVLWSALALKDAYVWFFMSAVVWASSEYVRSLNPWWHLATVLALLPIESVRRYIFVALAIAWVFVVLAIPRGERMRASAATAAVTLAALVGIMLLFNPLRDLGVNALYLPIAIREGSATGRTSFVGVPSVRGEPGDRVVVNVSGQTPAPGSTPRELTVQPGTQVQVEGGRPATGEGPVVIVRPGDILRIAAPSPGSAGATSASPTPAETPTPRPVTINAAAQNTVATSPESDSETRSAGSSLLANLRHLPVGVAYLLGAPFPWAARTVADLLTIPEVLLWYATAFFAAVGTVWLIRRRDLRFAHGIAALAAMGLIFALIESNVGTLLRSRDMMVPFTAVLGGVGIAATVRMRPGLLPEWLARSLGDGSSGP